MQLHDLIKKHQINIRHLAERMGVKYTTLVNKITNATHDHGEYYLTRDEEIKLRNVIKNGAEAILNDLKK